MRYLYFFGFLVGIIALLIIATNIEQNKVLVADTFVADGKTWRLSADAKTQTAFLDNVTFDVGDSSAGDVILKKIAIDSSNNLILKKHERLLAAPLIHHPEAGGLLEKPGDIEEQAFSIVLQKGAAETLLTSEKSMFYAPSGAMGSQFGLSDWRMIGPNFYYTYIIESTVHIVKLKKVKDTFEKAADISLPYEAARESPRLDESGNHQALLHVAGKDYLESANGDFLETGTTGAR